jgi:oxygen-independent coproporphyrinogen-3 oxidase
MGMAMAPASPSHEDADIERIVQALGVAQRVAYAPPSVYPMAAPAFVATPGAERPQPAGGQLGVYIHVPFCEYGCTFCFYVRRVGASAEQMQRYVSAAVRELDWVAPGTLLSQLYVGGGTPTSLPADLLDELLAAVFARVRDDGEQVHTVECSPETLTDEHLRVFRRRGIKRVSLGIQTFDDAVLDSVRRRHSGAEALAACERLVDGGFIVNVDLIYGLPRQTEAIFRSDFETVAAWGVDAVTAYHLRLNERTPVVGQLREDERLDMARLIRWRTLVQRTADALGYRQRRWYEFLRGAPVAGARKPHFEDVTSIGNQIGIGPSARSRLENTVYRNHSNPQRYLERVEAGQSPVEETFILGVEDWKVRFVALSLGDGKPLNRSEYKREFGCSVEDDYGETLQRLLAASLASDDGECISLTETGKLVYDHVTLAFYPRRARGWLEGREPLLQRRLEGRAS